MCQICFHERHPARLENGEVRYRNADEIRQALSGLSETMRIQTTYQDTEIVPLAPGIASVLTRFETRFVGAAATAFTFGGAITMVLVHHPDGWKIVTGHSSSPVPRRP